MAQDFFREKIVAAMLYGFRAIKKPEKVTVHPELMAEIREQLKDTQLAPKTIGDTEMFFGLPVTEDPTKAKEYLAVS